MILPADISNMMLQHLSLSHDEQMGAIRQHANGLMNNVSGNSAVNANRTQVHQVSANVLNHISNGNIPKNNGVSRLNTLPILNGTLQTEAARASASGRYATANPVKEKYSDDERGEQQDLFGGDGFLPDAEDPLSELLELQALQTVVETVESIQASVSYDSLFVSLVYCRHQRGDLQNQSQGQLMTVSPLVANGGRISAHTTLLMSDSSGDIKSRQLPSQVVFGQPSNAPDWMVTRMEKLEIYSQVAWRIQASGFSRNFSGAALVIGENTGFQNSRVDISVHVPGASQMWAVNRDVSPDRSQNNTKLI